MKQKYLALKNDLGITKGKTYDGHMFAVFSDHARPWRFIQLINDDGIMIRLEPEMFRRVIYPGPEFYFT